MRGYVVGCGARIAASLHRIGNWSGMMLSYVGAAADHLWAPTTMPRKKTGQKGMRRSLPATRGLRRTKTNIINKKARGAFGAVGDRRQHTTRSLEQARGATTTGGNQHQRGQGFLPLVWHKHLKLLSVACRSIGVGYHGSFQHRPVLGLTLEARGLHTTTQVTGKFLAQRARRSCSFVRSFLSSSSSSCCQQTSKAFFIFFEDNKEGWVNKKVTKPRPQQSTPTPGEGDEATNTNN